MAVSGISRIQDVAPWRLCIGCGACVAACTRGGVTLHNVESEGIRPRFDPSICRNCTDCLEICPGNQFDRYSRSDPSTRGLYKSDEMGPLLEVWVGSAADPEIRRQCSSGGMISAIALYCLEKEGMAFVLHSGPDPERPWLNRTVRSRSREEVLANSGSRYAPTSVCEDLGGIERSDRPCVFIGRPCDAAAADMLAKRRPDLDRNLGIVLSFCCAGTPSTRGTLDLIQSLGVAKEDVRSVRYRGDGWPGDFRVAVEGAKRGEERRMSYGVAWGRLTKYVGLRCRICPHGVGDVSDIACGDAWHRHHADEGNPGESIVLVRTPRGREILKKAMDAGYVRLTPTNEGAAIRAQKELLRKHNEVFGRLLGMRIIGVFTPRFLGFSLFRNWRRLSLEHRARSVLGTIQRVLTRGLWRKSKLK